MVDGKASSIDIMDRQPWIWRVANRELAREGKLDDVAPRQRLYLSINEGIFSSIRTVEVELADGRQVPGFLCEPAATEQAKDISGFGGWLGYLGSR